MPIDPSYPFASESRKDNFDGAGPAFQAWKATPTPQTTTALLSAIRPVLDTALTSYSVGPPSPTLRSRAKLMALKAMERYDPARGTLRSHLVSQLQGLRTASGNEAQIVGIPDRVLLNRNAVTKAQQELEDRLGRPASIAELSEHTNLSPARLAYIQKAHVPVNTGASIGEDGEVFSPASTIPGSSGPQQAWHEFVYRDLHPVDQVVMEHSLGLFNKPVLSTNRLAAKLGISAGAISQRKAKIQKMIDAGGAFGF